MKRIGFLLFSCLLFFQSFLDGQTSFIDYQKSSDKVSDIFKRKEDTLRKQFQAKKLVWPAKYVYIRSFKYDSQLEVWVKNDEKEPYQLFKSYKICALAGTLGPKRMEGDFQVPEGVYYINEFKPNSSYHLSLGLNYPNASDKILSDTQQPGGDIFIHGSCVTQGCIPITNPQIEELYIITSYARALGQDFIPVHIFPIRFNNPKSKAYLQKLTDNDADLMKFEVKMKQLYDYFESHKELPVTAINSKGEYLIY